LLQERERRMNVELVRLSKVMADRGMCSRREADDFIARGLVMVDGQPITQLGTKIRPDQQITLAPAALDERRELVTVLLNKPVAYVSGQPEKNYSPAVVLITAANQEVSPRGQRFDPKMLQGLAPAGRLDIDSRGLLVFTQDGTLARKLTAENSEVDKEYIVRVKGDLSDETVQLLRHGLILDDRPLKPAGVERLQFDQLRLVLREGRHRQIRRMCAAVSLDVLSLKRVRVGRIKLGTLPEGHWRLLEAGEEF